MTTELASAANGVVNGSMKRGHTAIEEPVVIGDGQGVKRARKDSPQEDSNGTKSDGNGFHRDEAAANHSTPEYQRVLLLHEKRQPYTLTEAFPVPVPRPEEDEVLIKIQHVGLNPIDWKAPDYGFGIPQLPYIAGRDLVGTIISNTRPSRSGERHLQKGDVVFSASTDYRDLRKAAFQEYAISTSWNVCRVPSTHEPGHVAGLGVAFIAAALAVGVCFGSDFSQLKEDLQGPDLGEELRKAGVDNLPEDVRPECQRRIEDPDPPEPGEWVAVWGGSSATALLVTQICKLLGLRVALVVDVRKHGASLSAGSADILVDSQDPSRAIEILRSVTSGKLRFGLDTVGRQTAELLRRALLHGDRDSTTNGTSQDGVESKASSSHIVGMTGLPKDQVPGIKPHAVPIKLHHEVPSVGESLMKWLENLLRVGAIKPPATEVSETGLEGVNAGLDRLRQGDVCGRRLAVKVA